MKRSILLAASLLTLAGCATQTASQHYSITPGVRVIERAPKKSSHVPAVVSGSAGAVQ
jgi:uncharacterized lipoprotein YajG